MSNRDPEKNFEELWKTFNDRYPFFALRNVDWKKQYDTFRPKVTPKTKDDQLFDIFCEMLSPLNDGHVELEGRTQKHGKKRSFTAERTTKFYKEFSDKDIKKLFKTTAKTLVKNSFHKPKETKAWMLHYGRSDDLGYMRILELEDIKKRKLRTALDKISRDLNELKGFIIDIRNCPGGDDDIAIMIINRFCDERRVAFHRKTKKGPKANDFGPLKTWYLEPEGDAQFTGPVVLLTNDSVFSGGEAFALAMRELPHVTILGDRTNGIFSYTFDRELPNGWEYCLSYQVYMSPAMECFEGVGVPVDIKLLNKKSDIKRGVDPLITRAIEIIRGSRKSRSVIA